MAFSFKKFTLRDVGSWYVKKSAIIPDIQRDLLWTPKQIALLWDSIFRGIPIGTFMMQKCDNGLLDGQQRLNAISTGFNLYKENSPDAMIWLDIQNCDEISDSDIMITTISQPWGYCKDDDRSILSASERREAFEIFKEFISKDQKLCGFYNLNTKLDLYCSWPMKATGLLIPLPCLLQKASDVSEYVENAYAYYATHFHGVLEYLSKHQTDYKTRLKTTFIGLFSRFKELETYEIGATIVDLESVRDVEMLFSRLNTGGTRISDDDLAYAIIKANFRGIKIKEKDELARSYNIEPAKLARIILRIAATSSKDNTSFSGNLSPKQIRQMAENKPENEAFISLVKEYYNNIESLLNKLKEIFDCCGIPIVLRVNLSGRTPDIYMLLLYICYRCEVTNDELNHVLCGMALYLKWFCNDTFKAVNTIYRCIREDINVINIQRGVLKIQSQTDSRGRIITTPLVASDKIKDEIEAKLKIKASDKWQPSLGIWRMMWEKTINNREMLVYFQRHYLSEHFNNYNPSNYKMWEGHNCPWDYDHIIPQNWFCSYSPSQPFARFCKYWLNSIGNLAAISFEANRSKSDDANWDYYLKTQTLEVDICRIKTIKKEELNRKQETAQRFAEICFDRYCTIYKDCYDTLFKGLLNTSTELFPEVIKYRKSMIQKIAYLINGDVYFVSPDATIELQINNYPSVMWAMPWLSCGFIVNEKYYVAVTMGFDEGNLIYEIGVRKAPNAITADESKPLDSFGEYKTYNSGWWYIERDLSEKEFKNLDFSQEFKKLSEWVLSNKNQNIV